MNLIRQPSTELLLFLTGYVTLRCDLDLRPFELLVMSRDATWVFNLCTMFEQDTANHPELGRLQFSIDHQLSPNFYVFLGVKGVKFQI